MDCDRVAGNTNSTFERIIESVSIYYSQQSELQVDEAEIQNFTESFDVENFKDETTRISLPLQFKSLSEEINFFCLVELLRFGSYYEPLLQAATGKGCSDTVFFGLINMHLSSIPMNATFLATIPTFDVGTHFNIPLYREEATEIEGVFADVPGVLYPYADKLRDRMNACGQILLKLGHLDLAAFVMDVLSDAPCSADQLCRAISDTFPLDGVVLAPNSERRVEDGTVRQEDEGKDMLTKVHFHRVAVRLTAELHQRFKDRDEKFRFEDSFLIPCYIDTVIISVLLHLRLIKRSKDEEVSFDSLFNSNSILHAQAAAFEACRQIAATINSMGQICTCAAEICYYFFQLSKDASRNKNKNIKLYFAEEGSQI